MKTAVRATSIESYHSLDPEKLNRDQQKVYDVLRKNGPLYDRQIKEMLNLEINVVTGRRNELLKKGFITEAGTATNPNTHKTVILWKVKEYEPILNGNQFQCV